jgi:hypothetical protein
MCVWWCVTKKINRNFRSRRYSWRVVKVLVGGGNNYIQRDGYTA